PPFPSVTGLALAARVALVATPAVVVPATLLLVGGLTEVVALRRVVLVHGGRPRRRAAGLVDRAVVERRDVRRGVHGHGLRLGVLRDRVRRVLRLVDRLRLLAAAGAAAALLGLAGVLAEVVRLRGRVPGAGQGPGGGLAGLADDG